MHFVEKEKEMGFKALGLQVLNQSQEVLGPQSNHTWPCIEIPRTVEFFRSAFGLDNSKKNASLIANSI